MIRRGRDKHVEVSAAMRQAIRRVTGARLSEGEHRTFVAALALTAGFGRLWDEVYVAEIQELTGTEETRLHEVTVRKHLLGFAERGILEWQPRRGTDGSGKGFRSRLGLPTVGKTEREQQTARGDQSERNDGSVSSEAQTERRLGDRVEQTPLGAEDLEQEGFIDASRAHAREGQAALFMTHPGAYSEPNS